MPSIAYEAEWGPEDVEEYVPLDIPPQYRTLNWERHDISVRDVWEKFAEGKLQLEPDFQRNYVWDRQRASRFIESVLLALPIPALFVSEESDGTWLVIDGHQRFETLFRFLEPMLQQLKERRGLTTKLPPLGVLVLSQMEVLVELNNKDIRALTIEDRRRLWDTSLPIIVLAPDSHPDMKYALFARLNLGSMSLNAQELRNCLYRGPYNNLIAKLAERQDFLRLWGKSSPDKRMRHRELTLRFFALLHRRDRYRTPFRHFLNMEMEEHRQASLDDLQRFEQQFNLATLWSSRVFGDEVFKLFTPGQESSPSGRWHRQRSDLVYEVEMVGFAHAGERLEPYWNKCRPDQRQLLAEGLRYRLIDAMSRDDFRRTLLERTRDASLVQDRFRLWIQAVDAAANSPDELIAEAGSLSDALSRSSLCDVCDTPVFRDDAARGSVPGTRARIHRYCKLSRA